MSGSGIAPDTMWIELDGSSPDACNTIMACVGSHIGNGLVYNAGTRTVSVRLSSTPGNTITFGTDGGLLGAGGSGGGSTGQTVATLPTGINTIIGSGWGAGSCMWPEGIRESILAARNYLGTATRMVHLPLRRSGGFFPIMLAEPSMGWYLQNGGTQTPASMDEREHSGAVIVPGGNPPSEEGGYFGFYQPTSQGSPTLGETFDALARRAVMVLEVRDTVSPGDTADRVKELAPQYEAQSCVIVAGEPVASTGLNGPTILHAVSASITGSGMPVGVVFRTRQQVIDFPPSVLNTLGVTWVFVHHTLVDPVDPTHVSTQVDAYRTGGLNVMLLGVHRQYQAARAATMQLRGSICTDPIYAYGAASLYRYRRDAPSWDFTTPNVGQHSPWSDTVVGQQAHYRGFVRATEPQRCVLPSDLHNPEQVEPYQSSYWILPGEVLPLRNASTYAVQCWFRWDDSIPTDDHRFVGLWFDSPTDRSFRDWSGATAQTIGYQFVLTARSEFILTEYDGTPGAPPAARVLGTWLVGYTMAPGFWYGLRAEVTPTQIRLYASTSPWPDPFTKFLVATISNPHRYISGTNQGYVYFGRHYFTQAQSRTNSIAGLAVQYSGF